MDHHLLVDGALKSDESIVNSLSNFSRKAKEKGSRDISVLYAFDLEEMEPICSMCFPGNMPDYTACETFLSTNKIESGIIVADKGFPESAASKYFKDHPNLHYLKPIKRNAKRIECDLDLPPEVIYKAYEKRWEIELVMRCYKSACEFDGTRVQDDYSVIGSEFCDFLSALLTFRLIKAFDKAHLLDKLTYIRIMDVLTKAKRVRLADNADWQPNRLPVYCVEILEKLDLLPKPEPRKRGRPKKSPQPNQPGKL